MTSIISYVESVCKIEKERPDCEFYNLRKKSLWNCNNNVHSNIE